MNNKKHINSLAELHACTSCQICSAVCPVEAISIELNGEGFFRPVVDENICIGCQKCTKYCYKFDEEVIGSDINELSKINHYAAVTNDKELLRKTSSGGIASEIASYLYDIGYNVVGVFYNVQTDCPEHYIARHKSDLPLFRGSKYIHANNEKVLKEILKKAKANGEKYAFFGLPCEVYAIDQFSRANNIREHFILIDLYCHGVPSYLIWGKYIDGLKKNEAQPIEYSYINFRSKSHTIWGEYRIEFQDSSEQTTHLSKNNDPFFELFFSNQLLNDSCSNCHLRGNLSYCDIRVGDFWGPKYILNRDGYSIVSANSNMGLEIINSLKGKILFSKCDAGEFVPYQSLFNIYRPDETLRNNLFEMLINGKKSLPEIVDYYYQHNGASGRLKYRLKSVLSLFPYRFTQIIKYFYYLIRQNKHAVRDNECL